MLYKTLKDGIRQRTSEGGWSTPKVGDIIKVSDIAAPRMIARGFIAPHGGPAPASAPEPAPESRCERKRRAWLGGEPTDTPPAPLGPGEATEPPPVTKENEGGAA